MTKIDPSETLLIGRWLPSNEGGLVADDTCQRINALVRSYLKKLGKEASGWDALYVDLRDGRLWELTYPQSELHGGGPPQLRYLAAADAQQKFGDIALRRHDYS